MDSEENTPGPVEDVKDLKPGDRILFGDRKTPLEVQKVEDDEAVVQGPKDGEYLLYDEDNADHPLVAKPGSKKYSSYAQNLRKVGEWIRKDDKWIHTGSGAQIKLEKNQIGYWNIQVKDFQKPDAPKYGFTNREKAREQVEKLVNSNPE